MCFDMKILAMTSIRSDYDLMVPLYKLLSNDKNIDFRILVSGSHLSNVSGYSVKEIENDKLKILAKLETLISSDSKKSRIKSASLLMQNSIDIISQFSPELILYAGDREDVIVGAMIGGYLEIPTAHFYSGDHVQDGFIDNPVRHATAKLSTVQVASTDEHKKRLLRIGEPIERIFLSGSIALDNFVNHNPISKKEIFKQFGLKSNSMSFSLVIFHPISIEREHVDLYFRNILEVLKNRGINAFISYPNVDPGNQKIIDLISEYKSENGFYFYKNLNRDLFLSIYKNSDFIIGNSSSGILEAASVPIPAINVGLRQKGRFAGDNVIFCETDRVSINSAVDKALDIKFLERIKKIKNPYGDGDSAQCVYEFIKSTNFNELIYKKEDPLKLNLL
jgi:UDP-hydrolysing UDP-N-acetyl-D-glucosamine 2-epimerase